jgi:hypothetical protein
MQYVLWTAKRARRRRSSSGVFATGLADDLSDEVDVRVLHSGEYLTMRFERVYLVRNTITNLTNQDEQVECFRNAAAYVKPGGCFQP